MIYPSARWLVMLLGAAVWIAATAPPAHSGNSCVDCHRRMATIKSLPTWYQDVFVHWYGSIHGQKGVTCDKCHRGRPDASTREKAHEGIKGANDPASPVYYKNLPETCGACHKGVYAQFIKSLHYKNLKNDRLAPTCTTCHGFEMDIRDVQLLRIVDRCAICHNAKQGVKPEVAERMKQIAAQIVQTKDSIRRAEVILELAAGMDREPPEGKARLHRARLRLRKTGDLWHGFHPDPLRKELEAIRGLADGVYRDAKTEMLKK